MNSKTIYKIGAADHSDIVIKQATVSKNHCELRWTEQGWQLRDLDSTNGTFVDGQRINSPSIVTRQQRITLGRDVPLALPEDPISTPTLPSPGNTVAQAASSTKSSGERKSEVSRVPIGLLFAGSIGASVLLLLAFVVIIANGKGGDNRTNDTNSNAVANMNNGLAESKLSGSTSATPDSIATATGVKEDPKPVQDVEESPFWAILIESADGKSQRLLGTAVAIESHRLVALASIAEAIEEVKDAFPKVFLTQPQQPNVRLTPSQIVIHPNFKKALTQLSEFETQLNDKIKGVESMSEPSVKESLEWSGKLEDIMFSISKSDLACFTTDVSLRKFLPLASSSSTEGAETCSLLGYPMIVPSPVITQNLQSYFLESKATLRMESRAKNPALFSETKDLSGIPMVSMVCLNQQSQVVGLCVKEVPVQGVGDPQRCQVSSIEVFWK